jgi:predicted DNA-binding transcriptional regulator AlpA
MHSVPTARRVIRGYRNLKAFTGYSETQTRKRMRDGKHPLPIKDEDQRACKWFEDEIAAMQAQLAKQRDAAQAKRELRVPSIDEVAAELSKPGNLPHRPRNRLQPRRR